MRLVRCDRCGEVADLARIRTCMGCDQPLPGAPSARPPGRIPPAQREARSDLGIAKIILLGLLAGGGITLALILLKEGNSLAAVVVLSGFLGVLLKIMIRQKRLRDAAPDVSPQPPPATPPRAPIQRWTCAKCGTVVEVRFDACWSCSAPRTLPEGKRAAVPVRTEFSDDAVRFTSTRPSSDPFEDGSQSNLMLVGAAIAIGIAGFAIYFIVCLASINKSLG